MSAQRAAENLKQRVLDKAQATATAALARAHQEAEQVLQEAEARAQEREEELVHAGMSDVERARKRIVSQAQLQLKGNLLERKAAILTDIIYEVRKRLGRLRSERQEGYPNLLLGLIRGALIGESQPGQILVYLSEKDLQQYGKQLQQVLQKELGLAPESVELLPAEIIGGVIIELPERRLQFDNSLEQILKEFKPQIERLVQREVFAPLEEDSKRRVTLEREGEKVEHGAG